MAKRRLITGVNFRYYQPQTLILLRANNVIISLGTKKPHKKMWGFSLSQSFADLFYGNLYCRDFGYYLNTKQHYFHYTVLYPISIYPQPRCVSSRIETYNYLPIIAGR